MRILVALAALTLGFAAPKRAADPTLLNLVMPEARAAAGMDVARLIASPLGQFLLAHVSPQAEQDLQRLRDATGFDPRTDLREILAAAPGGRSDARRIVAVRGSFDPARITARARELGAEATAHRGVEVLVFAAEGKRPAALALLSSSLAVMGDPDSVRLAIERRQQPGPALNPELDRSIATLSSVNDAWFVSLIPGNELAAPAAGAPANVLRAVERASGGVQLGASVIAAAEVTAGSAQDAAALADVVRLTVSLARLNQRDPRAAALTDLLNALEVSTSGDTLRLRLSVRESQLESAILPWLPR